MLVRFDAPYCYFLLSNINSFFTETCFFYLVLYSIHFSHVNSILDVYAAPYRYFLVNYVNTRFMDVDYILFFLPSFLFIIVFDTFFTRKLYLGCICFLDLMHFNVTFFLITLIDYGHFFLNRSFRRIY